MTESSKGKMIGFWVLTGLVGLSQLASGGTEVAGLGPAVESIAKLGYPDYFRYILGPAKIIGSLTLLMPRMPRLKEWAYAGFAIDFIAAFLSHLFSGEPAGDMVAPLVFLGMLMGSYALRPADRRLAG